jgi:hypothetical protein
MPAVLQLNINISHVKRDTYLKKKLYLRKVATPSFIKNRAFTITKENNIITQKHAKIAGAADVIIAK